MLSLNCRVKRNCWYLNLWRSVNTKLVMEFLIWSANSREWRCALWISGHNRRAIGTIIMQAASSLLTDLVGHIIKTLTVNMLLAFRVSCSMVLWCTTPIWYVWTETRDLDRAGYAHQTHLGEQWRAPRSWIFLVHSCKYMSSTLKNGTSLGWREPFERKENSTCDLGN